MSRTKTDLVSEAAAKRLRADAMASSLGVARTEINPRGAGAFKVTLRRCWNGRDRKTDEPYWTGGVEVKVEDTLRFDYGGLPNRTWKTRLPVGRWFAADIGRAIHRGWTFLHDARGIHQRRQRVYEAVQALSESRVEALAEQAEEAGRSLVYWEMQAEDLDWYEPRLGLKPMSVEW